MQNTALRPAIERSRMREEANSGWPGDDLVNRNQSSKRRLAIHCGGTGFAIFVVRSRQTQGRILVVDSPQPSDVIVVLAGETDRRPAHALQLLNQGTRAGS